METSISKEEIGAVTTEARIWSDSMKASRAKEYRWPLDSKNKKMNSPQSH